MITSFKSQAHNRDSGGLGMFNANILNLAQSVATLHTLDELLSVTYEFFKYALTSLVLRHV